ncbi:thioredoxin family protein [Brevibacillus choshinensis]|uniref:thioredoxin family protein n=1 Tax=Brevibacillus choshinensis TaxID=54911 RepID=UPI002E20257B|nr:thioredoxin family protein [Brevibacillus choshinensis]MED4750433.1 thioredoxin family protein [Brevibacillus choshinensis]MED4781050.1 thioredoxin family protein [Brevibacillus choshinensis]
MQDMKVEQFQQLMEQKQSFALFVYTPMCGTCKLAERMLTITFEALPNVAAYEININTAPNLAQQWEISSVPALLLFRDGVLIERHFAMQSVGFLYERLKDLN